MHKTIRVEVNGRSREIAVDVRLSLLELLRDTLGLTGTKEGCGVGECGACTVLVDGRAVDSCIYLAVRADGCRITSIEGISGESPGSLSDVQESFVAHGAVQCGFCTPGLVMAATAFLEGRTEIPDRDEIRRGLAGNLCRCTGYSKIVDAVQDVARKRLAGEAGEG
ncbi:MAG: (2Fe-2S)-binding protein [Treponema sp.]|nr:(2Fe-2S)-binding protein [Treponema sp.]